jgi:hypothetical protein
MFMVDQCLGRLKVVDAERGGECSAWPFGLVKPPPQFNLVPCLSRPLRLQSAVLGIGMGGSSYGGVGGLPVLGGFFLTIL